MTMQYLVQTDEHNSLCLHTYLEFGQVRLLTSAKHNYINNEVELVSLRPLTSNYYTSRFKYMKQKIYEVIQSRFTIPTIKVLMNLLL